MYINKTFILLATIIISLDRFFIVCHEKEKFKLETKGNVEKILIIVIVSVLIINPRQGNTFGSSREWAIY